VIDRTYSAVVKTRNMCLLWNPLLAASIKEAVTNCITGANVSKHWVCAGSLVSAARFSSLQQSVRIELAQRA